MGTLGTIKKLYGNERQIFHNFVFQRPLKTLVTFYINYKVTYPLLKVLRHEGH